MSAAPWYGRLLAWAGHSLAGEPGGLNVIALHSMRETPDPLFPHDMTAAGFDRLMAFVAQNHAVLPLGEAFEAMQSGRLPPRALCITFDDGYADNVRVALPILRRHGLRATFFIATGFLDGGTMWNDRVIETLRRCEHAVVDLTAFGLGPTTLDTPAQRRAAIDALLPRIKYLDLGQRGQALARLAHACGSPRLPDDLMMRSSEVGKLAGAGMEIGAHTVNHPILACEPLAQVEREIADSRDRLRALGGGAVDVFAYPNGQPGKDYRREHVELLARLGFCCAVTTAPGLARAGQDPFQLPRYTPWDPVAWRWSLRLLRARRYAAATV